MRFQLDPVSVCNHVISDYVLQFGLYGQLVLNAYGQKVQVFFFLDVHVDSPQLMQHLHADIRVIISYLHCMYLAVAHDVLTKRQGSLARMPIMSDDLEISFCVTVQDVANQDLK